MTGKVLCSYACVLHDWCLALAPARCVSVSLHRLLLPLSACDCLRRPKLTGVHDVCKRKKTSVMPGDDVLESRSVVIDMLRIDTQASDSFFHKKNTSQKHMAGVLAIYVKKCPDVSQATMGGRETHMKAAHRVERNVWFSSRDEHFESIILNARKKLEFCMEPPCGHLPH